MSYLCSPAKFYSLYLSLLQEGRLDLTVQSENSLRISSHSVCVPRVTHEGLHLGVAVQSTPYPAQLPKDSQWSAGRRVSAASLLESVPQ